MNSKRFLLLLFLLPKCVEGSWWDAIGGAFGAAGGFLGDTGQYISSVFADVFLCPFSQDWCPDTDFFINMGYMNVSETDQAIFNNSAYEWVKVLYRGNLEPIKDIDVEQFPDTDCNPAFPTEIDDLFICTSYKEDSVATASNIIGTASPFLVRSTGKNAPLPAVGRIYINSHLRDFVELKDVARQMIGHVLGLGSLYKAKRLLTQDDPLVCAYNETSQASIEYQKLSGCSSSVPLQSDAFTPCGQWDESCFRNELMTTTVAGGASEALSRITAGALEDLGYTVNYQRTDYYDASNLAPGCRCTRRLGEKEEVADMPGPSAEEKEARMKAIEYGKHQLRQRRQLWGRWPSPNPYLQFVGHDWVSVYYGSGGHVRSVVVNAESSDIDLTSKGY